MIGRQWKVIVYLILCSFLSQEIFHFGFCDKSTKAVSNTTQTILAHKFQAGTLLPTEIEIPHQYGTKVATYTPEYQKGNQQMVIHIKDMHCQYDAQMNIANLIKHISKEYGVTDVMVEGAAGKVDTSLFGAFPDKKVLEKVAKEFVKKGIVTGPEYLSMVEHGKIPLEIYGIEEPSLYIENLQAFREVYKRENDTKRFIEGIEQIVHLLQEKIYNEELFLYVREKERYRNKEILFNEFISFIGGLCLRRGITINRWVNVTLLAETMREEEHIDVEEVERQKEKVLDFLTKEIVVEDVEELVKKSLYYRLKKISDDTYFSYLEQLCERYIGPEQRMSYSELLRYCDLAKKKGRLCWKLLMNEVEDIDECLESELLENEIEKEIAAISRIVELLGKVFRLELTRKELLYYREHRKAFDLRGLLANLRRLCQNHGIGMDILMENYREMDELERVIEHGEAFYLSAVARDQVMLKNVQKKMKEDAINTTIIVTGGFHSEGVEKELKKQNISHVTFS
ncbi:hypothetical protein ACFL1T_04335, partial [Chlamydiota bacterium]